MALLALLALAIAHPAFGTDCEFGRTAIFATNSAWLRLNSDVLSGDVVVNDASSGPTLFPGHELGVGLYATTPAGFAVKADSLRVKATASLGGDVFCNDLTDGSGNVTCQPLPLPVCDNPPVFQAADPRPGAPDVLVPFNGSDTLAPGDYGEIKIRWRGSLTFLGGIYNVAQIHAGIATQMEFLAPTEIRVAGKLMVDYNSTVGPAAGSGLTAADIVFYVAGINGNSGNLWALPRATRLGIGSDVQANVYAPNGTVWIRQKSEAAGSFLGRDVILGRKAEVTLDSAFNPQPTADPQDLTTSDTDPLDITLTGSDPEGQTLTFSIVSGPSAGTLSAVTQSPPSSALVTYTANQAGNLPDSFTFRVTDPYGGSDEATVSLNDFEEPQDPPPLAQILAKDGTSEAIQGVPTEILLVAAAPQGQDPGAIGDLTFSISSGPAAGNTVSTPVPSNEVPVRSATVTYTAAAAFAGTDSFVFEACEEAVPTNCDLGTMTVNVDSATPAAPPVAVPQNVTTAQATPIEINLAIPAGQEDPSNETGRDDPCGNGVLDPGEECDDGNRLNGDGCDDQCNSEPQ
jgi:cysteine-rich repeat protein